jgi:hypothetical protein
MHVRGAVAWKSPNKIAGEPPLGGLKVERYADFTLENPVRNTVGAVLRARIGGFLEKNVRYGIA